MRPSLIAIAVFLLAAAPGVHAAKIAPVRVLFIEGQIDPAVVGYLEDGIRNAEDDAAQAVLIIMDTPGGRVDSTQSIIKSFFASKVPIIVYVAPNGAWAASAGVFITMAADIAAMAPVSNIGSASPVFISPTGLPGLPEDKKKPDKDQKKKTPADQGTMEKKMFNAVAEYAKSIAEKRGRNVEWAEKAVREADNLTSTDALKQNVIDYVADTVPQLMDKIDGRKVKMVSTGETVTLYTARAPLEERPMGAWDTLSLIHI